MCLSVWPGLLLPCCSPLPASLTAGAPAQAFLLHHGLLSCCPAAVTTAATRHATPRNATPRHATPRHATQSVPAVHISLWGGAYTPSEVTGTISNLTATTAQVGGWRGWSALLLLLLLVLRQPSLLLRLPRLLLLLLCALP